MKFDLKKQLRVKLHKAKLPKTLRLTLQTAELLTSAAGAAAAAASASAAVASAVVVAGVVAAVAVAAGFAVASAVVGSSAAGAAAPAAFAGAGAVVSGVAAAFATLAAALGTATGTQQRDGPTIFSFDPPTESGPAGSPRKRSPVGKCRDHRDKPPTCKYLSHPTPSPSGIDLTIAASIGRSPMDRNIHTGRSTARTTARRGVL